MKSNLINLIDPLWVRAVLKHTCFCTVLHLCIYKVHVRLEESAFLPATPETSLFIN